MHRYVRFKSFEMYRFDSDYLEGCLPEILERFKETNFEQTPGYGNDSYCAAARELICRLCEAPQADVHFLVGGTQTNSTVISFLLKPYEGVLCADNGHINVHETGAIEHGGHKVLALPGSDGKITAAQVEKAILEHRDDFCREHTVKPGMVYISFSTEFGTLYSKKELEELSSVCSKYGIPLFIDGARLGYGLSASSCDITIADLARLADVFYIGGTKQGALFGEAVVFKDKAKSENFRYFIKENGALLAKGRLLGLQFEVLFRDGLYFRAAREADNKAMRIREAFKAKGCRFLTDSYTNLQFPILPNEMIEKLKRQFSFEVWNPVDESHSLTRFSTSWGTTDAAIDELTEAISQL